MKIVKNAPIDSCSWNQNNKKYSTYEVYCLSGWLHPFWEVCYNSVTSSAIVNIVLLLCSCLLFHVKFSFSSFLIVTVILYISCLKVANTSLDLKCMAVTLLDSLTIGPEMNHLKMTVHPSKYEPCNSLQLTG